MVTAQHLTSQKAVANYAKCINKATNLKHCTSVHVEVRILALLPQMAHGLYERIALSGASRRES